MTTPTTYYVGSASEVNHHAQPLASKIPVQVISPEQVASVAHHGDVALFFSEHFDRFRNAIFELKNKHVPTIYAIDGILEWRNAWENREDEPACPWTMRPVLCDIAACIGNVQKRILDSWGNSEKTVVTGLPRLSELVNQNQYSSERQETSGDLKVLVATAKWPGFTAVQMDNARQLLRDLKDFFASTSKINDRQIEVTWRLTHQLAEEIGVENCLSQVNGNEIHRIISKHDIVLTTPSTIQLESMLLGRPTAIIDYNNCPHYVDSAWKITSGQYIEPVLKSMACPPTERLAYQRWILRDNLDTRPNCEGRIVDLIERVRELSMSKCFIDNSGFSSVSDHPGDHELSIVEHQRQFPSYDSFGEFDLHALQAQLAHSRREINLRQARIDQLESELGEAHSIFEQIEKHPIAGPIVKLRRGFKSLFSSLTRNPDKPH